MARGSDEDDEKAAKREKEEEETEIMVGTYEDYVLGYRVESSSGAPKNKKMRGDKNANPIQLKRFSLEQTFASRVHSGSVRCLAANANGSLACSAGFDEMISLFSLKRRKLLQTSEGAINCALFASNSHLILGDESGSISIYECKASSMTLVKTLRGHKMAVTAMDVHPSGKILLSLSKDNTMRTWNLIKGRCAYITNIRSQAHLVFWSRTGNEFMIAANNEIYLFNNNSGLLEHSLKLDKRINSIEFITDNIFIVASDSGKMEFFDLKEGVSLMKHEAHDARIKSIRCLSNDPRATQFATASSDGIIKLWSTDKPGIEKPIELASIDTGARLTCMTSSVHKYR